MSTPDFEVWHKEERKSDRFFKEQKQPLPTPRTDEFATRCCGEEEWQKFARTMERELSLANHLYMLSCETREKLEKQLKTLQHEHTGSTTIPPTQPT